MTFDSAELALEYLQSKIGICNKNSEWYFLKTLPQEAIDFINCQTEKGLKFTNFENCNLINSKFRLIELRIDRKNDGNKKDIPDILIRYDEIKSMPDMTIVLEDI